MTPYITAWIALFGWPLVALAAYRRYNLPVATAVTLIGGYLLLPHGVEKDFPLLPPLDKFTIPAIAALILTWHACRDPRRAGGTLPGWLPRDKLALLFMAMLVLGGFGTALTNTEVATSGGARMPAMRTYDGFSLALAASVMLIPFVLARKVFATIQGQRMLAIVLVGSAAAYAFLALWEVRMSPQLNKEIYGFFPHSWIQHKRGGGFRPIVFLSHGLWLGIFMASAAIAAFGLSKTETKHRSRYIAAGVWLLVTILLSKVLGALVLTLAMLPVLMFMPRRIQVMVAVCLGVVVMIYPILRKADVIPTQQAVALAARVSDERAQSLDFRFVNEDRLLKRAGDKTLFGWGGFGRNRVYNEKGKDISVSDGYWLILFGQGGWVRYIGEFGLLLLGIFRLFFQRRDRIDPITVALALALIVNLIDLLPNAGISPLTWMITGALIGRNEVRARDPDKEEAPIADTPRSGIRYTRDFGPPKPARGGVMTQRTTSGTPYRRARTPPPRSKGPLHG
jgi:hypothetical protein